MHIPHGSNLTRKQLDQITQEFETSELTWQNLIPGQILFMEHGNGWDFDYFAHEILEIDRENRRITYRDLSQDGKRVTLGKLYTIKELATRKHLPVLISGEGYTDQQIGIV